MQMISPWRAHQRHRFFFLRLNVQRKIAILVYISFYNFPYYCLFNMIFLENAHSVQRHRRKGKEQKENNNKGREKVRKKREKSKIELLLICYVFVISFLLFEATHVKAFDIIYQFRFANGYFCSPLQKDCFISFCY